MNKQDLAHWLREEHAMVEELVAGLRQHTVLLPRLNLAGWLGELRHKFDRFRNHLARHFELEEDDGYLIPVLERRPTLSPDVNRLKREHIELMRLIDLVAAELELVGAEDRLLAGDVRGRIEHLLLCLEDHENRENLLVSCAVTMDLGNKD